MAFERSIASFYARADSEKFFIHALSAQLTLIGVGGGGICSDHGDLWE